jgi:hypothetical protein
MIFTTVILIEVIIFVLWLISKVIGMIHRHKVLSSIIVIGAIYLIISGYSNNVVSAKGHKNNIQANATLRNSIYENDSNDSYFHERSQSVLYPGDNGYETGADGHRITLQNNESAVNPTYQQMADFIKSDSTDEIPYNFSSFDSADFAEHVQNNAESAGYKCAWVHINFNDGMEYICNAFSTVDKGLVFVDCTNYGKSDNDKIVDPKVGMECIPKSLDDNRYIYYSIGIVKSYQIYW